MASEADNISGERLVAKEPPLCPVDRLPTRRRNAICIAVLAIGLANFVAYTFGYWVLGGDAHNGGRNVRVEQADGSVVVYPYAVRGHYIRSLNGKASAVSRGEWIYSYVHSILVPITSAAMIVSMLILARPHILATMRGGWISGQTFVTVFGTVVVLLCAAVAASFVRDFILELSLG